jgi:retron-type reverse transcriptase
VQVSVRIILEAIYEPGFCKTSLWCKQKQRKHQTLNNIEQKWKELKYIIKEESTKPREKIHNKKLIYILKKRIKDTRFVRLIWKILK